MPLTNVAHGDCTCQPTDTSWDSFNDHLLPSRFHLSEESIGHSDSAAVQASNCGAFVIKRHGSDQQTDRRSHPSSGWQNDLWHAQLAGQTHTMDRACPAKGDKGEEPGIFTAFDGEQARRTCHVGVDGFVDTPGRRHDIEPKGEGDVLADTPYGRLAVQRHMATKEICRVKVTAPHASRRGLLGVCTHAYPPICR